MTPTVEVDEYRSHAWKYLAIVSVLITLISFGAYLSLSNAFWVSIFRLVAFAGFAAVVFTVLRVRDKPKHIELFTDPQNLSVRYHLKGEELKEELFERDTIKAISKRKTSSRKNIMSLNGGYTYTITFTDTDTELHLFTFSGRAISVPEQDARKIDQFLSDHHISG